MSLPLTGAARQTAVSPAKRKGLFGTGTYMLSSPGSADPLGLPQWAFGNCMLGPRSLMRPSAILQLPPLLFEMTVLVSVACASRCGISAMAGPLLSARVALISCSRLPEYTLPEDAVLR